MSLAPIFCFCKNMMMMSFIINKRHHHPLRNRDTSHPGVLGSIPKREEPGQTGRHPVLKYRVPHGSQVYSHTTMSRNGLLTRPPGVDPMAADGDGSRVPFVSIPRHMLILLAYAFAQYSLPRPRNGNFAHTSRSNGQATSGAPRSPSHAAVGTGSVL
jgi:hypothetical protein